MLYESGVVSNGGGGEALRSSAPRRSLSAAPSSRTPSCIGYWPSSPVTGPSTVSSRPS